MAARASFHPRPTGGELQLVRFYRQPIDKVWAALATPQRIADWMGVEWLSGDTLSEGASFDYRFRDSDLESRGIVLRFDPPFLLEHSWFDNLPPGAVVRWELAPAPQGEGCVLTLTHLFRTADDAPRTAAGWTQILESLAAALGEAAEDKDGKWPVWRDLYAGVFPPEGNRDGRRIEEEGKPALRFERLLDAPADSVWAALVDPGVVPRWMQADVEVDPRVGGRYRLTFHEWDHVMAGLITRWEPPHLLEYLWTESEANGDSRVRFEIFADGDRTRLVLTHRLDAGGDLADFASGWHWHLDALDGALAGESRVFDKPRWELLRQVYRMTLPGGAATAPQA